MVRSRLLLVAITAGGGIMFLGLVGTELHALVTGQYRFTWDPGLPLGWALEAVGLWYVWRGL